MFKTTITILFLALNIQVFSQISVSEAEVMFQNRHIWRGTRLGTAPVVEPSVTFTEGHFSFNVWASATTNNSYSEIDLIPSWQLGELTFSVLDYYNPVLDEKNQYLNFTEGKNRHSLEFSIDNYSGDKNRLKWMVGTFIAGDKNEETRNPFYSTYLELKYPFSFLKIDAEPFVGLTPYKGYYANQPAVINSGIAFSKEIRLSSNLSIPIIISYIYNPYRDEQFVTLGTGFVFSSGE